MVLNAQKLFGKMNNWDLQKSYTATCSTATSTFSKVRKLLPNSSFENYIPSLSKCKILRCKEILAELQFASQ